MDASLRRAAEQEMRRNAPDAPPSKRPRTDSKDGAARGFSELGRFDYRAAEQLAQGAQGFIVTCGFQRDKSATREAIAVLEETAANMSSSAKPAFTIVKLPYCGVILLTWRASQEAHTSLPAPSTVVERLVHDVHSKKHPALKHVQRITPVDGMCLASDTALRQLVHSLAEAFAQELSCRGECLREELIKSARSDILPLSFAVAFKSRFDNSQKSQIGPGSRKWKPDDSSAAMIPASGAAHSEVADDRSSTSCQPDLQQAEQAARDVMSAVSQQKASSVPRQHVSGISLTVEGNRGQEGESRGDGEGDGSQMQHFDLASKAISRGGAIAATAEGFAIACKGANVNAEVDLKQPSYVICLEILPVGKGTVAAVSIVDSKACVLKPKLILKPLQLQIHK